jgi:DNA-binding NarL/FixJ family response regulator
MLPLTERRLEAEPLRITPSERQALRLLANGGSRRDIERVLGVTGSTLDAVLTVLFARMGVHGKTEAIGSAFRRGLLESRATLGKA